MTSTEKKTHMNIKKYTDKVIAHFKSGNASEEHWKLLGQVVLKASEDGEEYSDFNMREFDQTILSDAEYRDLYAHLLEPSEDTNEDTDEDKDTFMIPK